MRRLQRRSGALLASLGVAISALLVAPVSTAPAQANHITSYDNANWRFSKTGSWWRAYMDGCFTTNWQYLERVAIVNNGSQGHYFQWKWTDYYDHTLYFSPLQYVPPNSPEWALNSPSGGWGALSQTHHPRVKIYWENSANEIVLLWDLNPWSDTGFDHPATFQGANTRGCK